MVRRRNDYHYIKLSTGASKPNIHPNNFTPQYEMIQVRDKDEGDEVGDDEGLTQDENSAKVEKSPYFKITRPQSRLRMVSSCLT